MSTPKTALELQEITNLPYVVRSRLKNPRRPLTGLTADSRRAGQATAFYALRGQSVDGHRFAPQAVGQGAPALFVSDPEAFDHWSAQMAGLEGLFLVQTGREPLGLLSAQIYGHPSRQLALMGVTGTNGKTTVSHLAAQTLWALGQPCGLIGGLGMKLMNESLPSERTTPEAPEIQAFLAQAVAKGARWAAMEVSSIGLEQHRTLGLQFSAAAFTNFSQDHLDYHETMEAYLEAKKRLFSGYRVGTAVYNLDDPDVAAMAPQLRREGRPALSFSLSQPADLAWEGLTQGAAGMEGRLVWQGRGYPFRSPLLGQFNAANLLAAAGLLLASGLPVERVVEGLSQAQGAPGRFQPVALPDGRRAVVDYAHTPDGLLQALNAARRLTQGRLWLVFGCGGDRDKAKRPLMGQVAARLADRLVLTSDNPRNEDPLEILEAIQKGVNQELTPAERKERVAVEPDRRQAIHWALSQAQPGDLVLVAGKGHENYQEIQGARLPFLDSQVVAEWGERP